MQGEIATDQLDAEAVELLRSSPLSASLTERDVRQLAHGLRRVYFAAGDVLIREGQPGDCWYLVRRGMAAVVHTDLIGHEVTVAVFGRGQSFGEAAVVTGRPEPATVRAITQLDVYVLEAGAFRDWAQTCPSFASGALRHVDLLELDAFLKRASPFADLPAETLGHLVRQLQPERVQAGEVVMHQGDEADRFYLLRSGRLEVCRGQRRLAVLEAGDFVGEVALLTKGHRNATVRALETTDLLGLSRIDFETVVREDRGSSRYFQEVLRIRYQGGAGQPLLVPDPLSTVLPFMAPRRRRHYWLAFGGGAALFALLTHVAAQRGDHQSVYAALAVGAFIGPMLFVVYLARANILHEPPVALLATAALGALLGLPLSIILQRETGVMPGNLPPALLIALIEEPAKLLGVVWLLRRPSLRFQMDGVIYGAAAGMGFAAAENLLYGLARMEAVDVLLATLWLRALLSPFTHGTWTALVCAAVWRARQTRSTRAWWMVLLAFGTAVLLHGLWNWRPFPIPFNFAWLLVTGGASILLLRSVMHRALTEERSAVFGLNPRMAQLDSSRHTIRCRGCGQLTPPGARYCPRCGLALRRELMGR